MRSDLRCDQKAESPLRSLERAKAMHARDRERTVPYRESHAFGRSQAYVPRREDARKTRFQGARLAILERPLAARLGVGAGHEVALRIARDFVGEPVDVRFGANENKD